MICETLDCWILMALLSAGVVGQAGLILWARRRFERRAAACAKAAFIERAASGMEGKDV